MARTSQRGARKDVDGPSGRREAITIPCGHEQHQSQVESEVARAGFAAGEVLSDTYSVVSTIASGGMGCVHLAEDRVLCRTVAIKVSLPGVSPDTLRNEARVLAAFRHPGLPAVYSFGFHRGLEYMVMERIPGVTMASYLAHSGPEPPRLDEAVDILLSLTETLTVLHEAGLAHRDLKPENIMLAGHGRVVLLDCGIARQERFMADERLIWGSPLHMAPESFRACVRPGEAHLVDLYALAVVAFQLITLHLPFLHENVAELGCRHVKERAPRIRSLRADVPVDLDDLIAQMLEKTPADRPPSVRSVNTTLQWVRRHLPGQHPPGASAAAAQQPRS